jgi:hypothetical protein
MEKPFVEPKSLFEIALPDATTAPSNEVTSRAFDDEPHQNLREGIRFRGALPSLADDSLLRFIHDRLV